MWSLFLFLFPLLSFTFAARMTEQECTPVDLTEKLGKVRRQNGNTCWAYAAAEIAGFENGPASALYFAHLIKKSKPGDKLYNQLEGFSGGTAFEALKETLKGGYCPEYLIPSISRPDANYSALLKHYQDAESKKKSLEDECRSKIATLDVSNETMVRDLQTALIETEKELIKVEEIQSILARIFPKAQEDVISDIFAGSNDFQDFMTKLAAHQCSGFRIKLEEGLQLRDAYGQPKTIDLINEAFSQGRPTAVSMVSNGLLKIYPDSAPVKHAVTAAGRKWIPGENGGPGSCYYVFKNSWGEDWVIPQGSKALNTSQKGYFMIPEETLSEVSHQAFTLLK